MNMIFRRRARLGLSQGDLGKIAGVAQSEISRLERNATDSHRLLTAVNDALTAEEADRRLPPLTPPRTFRIEARRLRLKLTRAALAELSGFIVGYLGADIVARAEAGNGTQTEMTAIRRALIWEETRDRRRREERRRQAQRIDWQRSLWAALPDHPAVHALKTAMLDRAVDLLHEGTGAEADAISEFLPEAEVIAVFDRYLDEILPPPPPAETVVEVRPAPSNN